MSLESINPVERTVRTERLDARSKIEIAAIGGGPSNLSLAALSEGLSQIECQIFERESGMVWHSGMLLQDAQLQVSYLKDLVTLVDPTSRFSFLSFLHEKDWLYRALVANRHGVSRRQYEEYLKWVASKLSNVNFNSEVLDVTYIDGRFEVWTNTRQFGAEHLVVGVGKSPRLPEISGVNGSDVHSSRYCDHFLTKELSGKTVAVIGGGQSGAEIVADLLNRHHLLDRVVWITSRVNLLPLDDSPFVNEHYTPAFSNFFHSVDADVRRSLNSKLLFSSDGISASTLDHLYRKLFELECIEKQSEFFNLYSGCILEAVEVRDNRRLLTFRSSLTGTINSALVDEVIFATGYRFELPEFLRRFEFEVTADGNVPRLTDAFEIVWEHSDTNKIFLQNSYPAQLGLADANLSLIAWRSAKILNCVLGTQFFDLGDGRGALDWQTHQKSSGG